MSDLEQVLDRLAELLRRLDPRPPADDGREGAAAPDASAAPSVPQGRTA